MFVVIEGIDGAGTTTQARLVAERLVAQHGRLVHTTREPSDLPIGRLIRDRLRAKTGSERAMALLFAADRLDHVDSEIAPALAAGQIVLSDRYTLSSLAYQGELLGQPIDGGFVQRINQHARAPDLTFYLRISAEAALARRVARGGPDERYDDLALQRRLVARYDALAAADATCVTLDATLAPDVLTARIVAGIRGCP